MKQTISRTISFTIINFVTVEGETGKPVLSEEKVLKVAGKMDNKQATKELESRLDGTPFLVLSLETDSQLFEMSLDFFVENATQIETEKDGE